MTQTDNRKKYSIQEQNDFIGFRDLVETLCHKIDTRKPGELDDLTLEAFVSKHSTTRATLSSVGIWTRAMLGLEPSEVSALYFLHYCKSGGGLMQMRSDQKGGGQALRCKTGKVKRFNTLYNSNFDRNDVLPSRACSKVEVRYY